MRKPRNRSALRTLIGHCYFVAKKKLEWIVFQKKFSNELRKDILKYKIFEHQSLLLRPLKDLEMWMQFNKITNLKLALKRLDGLTIKPGEIFSYWKMIGRPTKAKGYLPGMVLHMGSFKAGVGGGLCQLSNLIYWMTLHTPLTVTERWRHSYDVFPDVSRTQPFGSGATCSYPNIDLQIKNETNQTFQLKLFLTETHLHGEWRSDRQLDVAYEIEERNHHIKQEWWGGYSRNNELLKIIYSLDSHKKLSEELVAKNQAIMMYDPLLPTTTKDKSA